MRLTSKLVISVFVLTLSFQLKAAGEWKNPDLETGANTDKKTASTC